MINLTEKLQRQMHKVRPNPMNRRQIGTQLLLQDGKLLPQFLRKIQSQKCADTGHTLKFTSHRFVLADTGGPDPTPPEKIDI